MLYLWLTKHLIVKVKKNIVLIFFFSIALLAHSSSRLVSLLYVLDRTIEQRDEYKAQKELSITNLKKQLSGAVVDKQRYSISRRLFNTYINYQTDSAYHLAHDRVQLAQKMGTVPEIAEAHMDLAAVLRTTGMYKEALEELEFLRINKLTDENKAYYYHLCHSLYMLMVDYSISEDQKKKYRALVFNYKDSILNTIQNDELTNYLVRSSKELMLGNFDQALQIANKGYMEYDSSSAMLTYTLSEIYHHLGDSEAEKEYLAMSAIADLQAGVKEYISLQRLGALLYDEGDIDRAYRYMKCAMEDAIFSNSRLRALEISQILPLINNTYDHKMKEERTRLVSLLILTAVLALVLLGAILYIYKQVKILSSIRKHQKKINTELKAVNEELNQVNSLLTDANLVKEEYIGYVFNICSSYIDKLEDYRVDVNRKLKTGQLKELEKMTSSSSLVADELKEFYRNFDTIFLNIYPTFIEEFNALMNEDGKIIPKEGDLLTTELRIFALVRLGINDSTKIADFLHYSPQTIYNYRLKIRNNSLVDKGDFSVELDKIGLSKISSTPPKKA